MVAVSPPTVVAVRRYGIHRQPTKLVLAFSAPLDPARADNARNYRLVAPDGRAIAVDSASYDPATRTVTLRPHAGLNVHRRYRLTVVGSGAGGIVGASGVPLAGAGAAGTDFLAVVGPRNLVLPVRAAARS